MNRNHYTPWNSPYAIVNNGQFLSYGHPPKPELTLANHPPPPYSKKFDYSVPIMGQPSDHKKEYEDMRAAAKAAKIAEEARTDEDLEQVVLTPEQEEKEIKWREYRIRLREWEDDERDLRKKMAAKLPFEK